MNLRRKIIGPVTFALLGLVVAFFLDHHFRERDHLNSLFEHAGNTFDDVIDSEIISTTGLMRMALHSLAKNPDFQKGLKLRDRKFLIKAAQADFERLKIGNHISYFNFFLPDQTNLLRMQNLEHFGDKVERKTLTSARTKTGESYGLDQGPSGMSVLRIVEPVFYQGKQVGFLELGTDFQEILQKTQSLLHQDAVLITKKSRVDRATWEKRNAKYGFQFDWDFFPDHVMIATGMKDIPSEIKDISFKNSIETYTTDLQLSREGKTYDVILVPGDPANGRESLDVVLFYDSSEVRWAVLRYDIFSLFAILAIAGTLISFFYLLLSRVELVLRKQQASLLNSSKMASLGEMAGGVAHEINTPLAIISLNAEQLSDLIQEKVVDREMAGESLITISNTVKRISNIVNGLKTFSREGKNDRMRPESIKAIVDQTFDLCKERFKHQSVALEVTTSEKNPNPFTVECRATEISQVLLNLLGNSYDAIYELPDRWVKIHIADLVYDVEISITDSGRGIPKEIQAKMMQPFFTTKAVGKGTGLGLSVSQGIIMAHHGKITVDNSHPNTRIVLVLPKHQPVIAKSAA